MKFDFAIVSCLVEHEGKYLIVQESKPGRTGLYNLPGGHIDDTESFAEAAIREVEEESGYRVELVGVIGVYQTVFTDRQMNIGGPTYLAKVVGGEARVSDEHPEVRWVTADELLALSDSGKFWTKYPPIVIADYLHRGVYPLDTILSETY